MKRRASAGIGAVLVFLAIGGAWVTGTHLLPEGIPRTIFLVALALAFVGGFVGLLASRLRAVLAGTDRLRTDLGLVGLQLTGLILAFGAVHARLGLLDNTGDAPRRVEDFWTAVYYSVVTFTTLGYGDLYPVGAGRALAAIQALTGYIVLGMLASSAAALLSPHEQAGTDPE